MVVTLLSLWALSSLPQADASTLIAQPTSRRGSEVQIDIRDSSGNVSHAETADIGVVDLVSYFKGDRTLARGVEALPGGRFVFDSPSHGTYFFYSRSGRAQPTATFVELKQGQSAGSLPDAGSHEPILGPPVVSSGMTYKVEDVYVGFRTVDPQTPQVRSMGEVGAMAVDGYDGVIVALAKEGYNNPTRPPGEQDRPREAQAGQVKVFTREDIDKAQHVLQGTFKFDEVGSKPRPKVMVYGYRKVGNATEYRLFSSKVSDESLRQ